MRYEADRSWELICRNLLDFSNSNIHAWVPIAREEILRNMDKKRSTARIHTYPYQPCVTMFITLLILDSL
jgi:hypothetical protein